jgi:hypothetical protein
MRLKGMASACSVHLDLVRCPCRATDFGMFFVAGGNTEQWDSFDLRVDEMIKSNT